MIHQDRLLLALAWVDELKLPAGAAALDVGCGPGHLAVTLARRGFRMTAVDSSDQMRQLARERVAQAEVGDRVEIRNGDAEQLEFKRDVFDLVVALGVLPYLEDPWRALAEFARVTRPGGYVIVSSDNRRRINRLLDPRFAPVLSPVRNYVKDQRDRRGAPRLKTTVPPALAGATRLFSLPELERMVASGGMSQERSAGVGFGLFTFMGRVVLSERAAVRTHRLVQPLGSRGVRVIRSVAVQNLLLARVP
jgi:SAM-dependent methyltransferase